MGSVRRSNLFLNDTNDYKNTVNNPQDGVLSSQDMGRAVQTTMTNSISSPVTHPSLSSKRMMDRFHQHEKPAPTVNKIARLSSQKQMRPDSVMT